MDSQGLTRWWDGCRWTHYLGPAPLPMRQTYSLSEQERPTSHLLHLVLTILTGGLWGFVWLGVTIWNKSGNRQRVYTRVNY